jgi:hypothetical protein
MMRRKHHPCSFSLYYVPGGNSNGSSNVQRGAVGDSHRRTTENALEQQNKMKMLKARYGDASSTSK